MKKILVPLLVLALVFLGAAATAAADEAITLEVNTAKLPLYAADDPYLAGFGMSAQPEGEALQVLVLQVKKSLQLQAKIGPQSVKNKRFTLSADNAEVVKTGANSVTGLKPGEAVLTVASQQDPSVTVQYRVLVIQPVTRITVSAPAKSVAVGETMALTAAYSPENASMKEVTWSSANENIATVDENGVVTGVKRGNARITAVARDGSKMRANISVAVTQSAEQITLDKQEITVDAGKSAMLKATVLPKDTSDKTVVWSSSDESVATVNRQGRVTGVALGDCEIICASKATGDVQTKAVVHVQQPVKKITFGDAPAVYVGETAQLTWTVEPANASNPAVTFKSGNPRILTVSDDGTITGIQAGQADVTVKSTDGSNRQARIRVKVYQHVTGVHMMRHTAYIDPGQTCSAGAILEPKNATNHNMTWESADPDIATADPVPRQSYRVNIRGISKGETTVTGTTEDGGYQTSITVKVGNYYNALKITDAYINGKGWIRIRVKNVSNDLPITWIKLAVEAYYYDGTPANVNTKDGSNVFTMTYGKRLNPGKSTPEDEWKAIDFDKDLGFQRMVVRVIEYQIDNDWVKSIPKGRQPKYTYKP